MELQFAARDIACMGQILHQTLSQEVTQEVRLSDSLPDIGRVICARGQTILRTKQWRSDSVSVSGGMMVWVLYAPEDGTRERWVDTWIPFQMKWEIPRADADGIMRVLCQTAGVDARTVSARKIMVRGQISALAQAFFPQKVSCSSPGEVPEDVCLLKNTYPVRLLREAGEKAFNLEEELTLPESCPAAQKILCFSVDPQITEQSVTGDKVVFRGNTNLHVLYECEEGKLHAWDFAHPFAQLAQLENVYSGNAQAQVLPGVTSVELDVDDEGKFQLKCGMVGQYTVDDEELIELVEDAYSTERMLSMTLQPLDMHTVLDKRRETKAFSQEIACKPGQLVDYACMTVQPRTVRSGSTVTMELTGQCSVLYYDENGSLRSENGSWEDAVSLDAEENCQVYATMGFEAAPKCVAGANGFAAEGVCELEILTCAASDLPMVTALEMGEQRQQAADRPSLILRRAGGHRLWDIAKQCNTTVDAICDANHLSGQPEPGQMLLIPMG